MIHPYRDNVKSEDSKSRLLGLVATIVALEDLDDRLYRYEQLNELLDQLSIKPKGIVL